MSLFTHLSQNLFSTFFGKKKSNEEEQSVTVTSREVNLMDDTNSTLSTNSIPSFSVLNHSPSRDRISSFYHQPSTLSKRENIFFGKDIESNDTNEIINYNLKKLRKVQEEEVITTQIETSSDQLPLKNEMREKNNNTSQPELTEVACQSPTEQVKSASNHQNNNIATTAIFTENIYDVNHYHNNKDVIEDDETESETETETETDKDSSSSTDSDTNTSEKSTINIQQNLSQEKASQSKNKENDSHDETNDDNQKNDNVKKSRHSSIDLEDFFLEDLDLDKLIYNVPPPFSKVNSLNLNDTQPLTRCTDTMSVPATFSKLGRSYNTNRNILSQSLRGNSTNASYTIPGIKTIELRKPNQETKRLSQTFNYGRKRLSIPAPFSTSFSPKELSAPLSSSLLALQNEQPSFASILSDEAHSNEVTNDTDSSFYVFEEDEEDYDIFNYSMKEL